MVLDLLQKRRSVRQFSRDKIPAENLKYILECGRLSPSGGNEQPWMFGLVIQPDRIIAISKIAYNQHWMRDAAALIVLCTVAVSDARDARNIQKSRFPKWGKAISNLDKGLYDRLNQEEHQTKIPGTHMAVAALEKGIGTTWVSHFRVRELSDYLQLPANILPSEILVMGYPADEGTSAAKKPLESIVFRETYGNK